MIFEVKFGDRRFGNAAIRKGMEVVFEIQKLLKRTNYLCICVLNAKAGVSTTQSPCRKVNPSTTTGLYGPE